MPLVKPARRIAAPIALALATLALAACQQDKAETAQSAQASEQAAPEAKPGAAVSDATLVLPAVSGNPAAAYFTLANAGDKAVTLAAVAIDGAGKAEMHQTTGGSMSPVAAVEVKPGEPVKFAPGGLHVMAFELDPKLTAGSSTEMTLTFADGDKLSAQVRIVARGDAAAMAGGMDHGDGH